jgi:hypothetical protein
MTGDDILVPPSFQLRNKTEEYRMASHDIWAEGTRTLSLAGKVMVSAIRDA